MKILKQTRFEDELCFIRWIFPADPLYQECIQCLEKSSLKGADLYHLATALWFCEGSPNELTFLSCDQQQRNVAKKLGFRVL